MLCGEGGSQAHENEGPREKKYRTHHHRLIDCWTENRFRRANEADQRPLSSDQVSGQKYFFTSL